MKKVIIRLVILIFMFLLFVPLLKEQRNAILKWQHYCHIKFHGLKNFSHGVFSPSYLYLYTDIVDPSGMG